MGDPQECPRCTRTGRTHRPIFMTFCPWVDRAGNRTRLDAICPRCGHTIIQDAAGTHIVQTAVSGRYRP